MSSAQLKWLGSEWRWNIRESPESSACNKFSILITSHIPVKQKVALFFFISLCFILFERQTLAFKNPYSYWGVFCIMYCGKSQALICIVNVSSQVNCEDIGHPSRFIRQLSSWRYCLHNALMLPLWKQPLAAECYYLTGLTLLKIETLMPLLNFILHTSKQFIIVCSQQL